MINRNQGICALALLSSSVGVAFGFSAISDAASAVGHANGWHGHRARAAGLETGNGHGHAHGHRGSAVPAPAAPPAPAGRTSASSAAHAASAAGGDKTPPGHGGVPRGNGNGGTPPGQAKKAQPSNAGDQGNGNDGTPPGQAKKAQLPPGQAKKAQPGYASDHGNGNGGIPPGQAKALHAATGLVSQPVSQGSGLSIAPGPSSSVPPSQPTPPLGPSGPARNFPSSANHANSTATARGTRPTTTTGGASFGFPLLTTAPGLPGIAPAGAAGAVPGASAPGIAAGALAATSTPVASARASTHRTARASAGAKDVAVHGNGSHQTQIERLLPTIEHVVPGAVWVALGVSLALAALGGTAALLATRRVRRNAGQFAAVSAAALTDPLTGLLNRRGFLEAFDRELARARRYNRQFVLAYLDVRGLKAVNDSEGHLAGDELLKSAAVLLSESARADDVVGRIGGDEMALLLVEQGPEGASAVIRRIVDEVPARRGAMGLRSNWDLTIGTASFPKDGSSTSELLAAADRRLYEQRGIALR